MTVNALSAAGLAILAWETALFVVGWARRDNGVADAGWGPGFVAAAGASFLACADGHPRQWLLLAMTGVWAARLAQQIVRRGHGHGEDFRYRRWRESWGRWFLPRSLLQIYLLQGALMWLVALPLSLVNARPGPAPLGWLDLAGVGVWGAGLLCETFADEQLLRFRRDPARRTRLLQSGLWRWSRHPNYFGEALLWWGVWLVALPAPHGWLAVASPLLVLFLLLRVSGIPMLEAKYRGDPEFEAYRARTSAFVPWPPKR
jgi:steroid 5-alpha reductase family enzyme